MNQDVFNLLCPFQRRWLKEPAMLALGEKSRRIGWTWTHALGAVIDRIKGLGNYYHSSVDDTASVEFIDYCAEWARMGNAVAAIAGITDETELIEEREIHRKVMTFTNGRKIVAGSSNPNFLRSKGGAVGLDEFAFHRDGRALLKAAHATAIFWGHPLRVWSTHNGEGYFGTLIDDARAGRIKAAVHSVTILDAIEDGIVERIRMRKGKLKDVPKPEAKARQEWLDELRATCPDQDAWNEEFMCIRSPGGRSLLSYDLITACERSPADLPIVEDPRELKTNAPIYVGFDVGRKRDLSVIWGLVKVGDVFETRLVKRFSDTTYQVQEEYLNLLLSLGIRRICIDSTGIGNMLAERAAQRWGYRAEMVGFTPAVKSELAMPLKRLFEDRLIRIPADASVRESLHKVQRIVTAAGNVRFDAKTDDAGHADEFWALALAYHAADDLNVPLPPPMDDVPDWLRA